MMQNEFWICFFGDAANSFSYDIIVLRLRDIVHQVANGQQNSQATFQVFKQVWQVLLRLCGGPKKTEKLQKKKESLLGIGLENIPFCFSRRIYKIVEKLTSIQLSDC